MTSSTEMLYSSRAPNGHVRYPADITVLADMDAVAELGALTEAEPGLRQQLSERELDSGLRPGRVTPAGSPTWPPPPPLACVGCLTGRS
jgi:hypothetical protein